MNKNTKIVRNPNVIAKDISQEFIIIDPQTGNLYRLNETAKQIWKSTRTPKTIDLIIEDINSKFSTNKKSEKEIVNFIQKHLNSLFYTV